MQYKQFRELKLSKIGFGGAKLLKMDLEQGNKLLLKARELGISVFDSHYRYGNCEKIMRAFSWNNNDIVQIYKVSAYETLDRANILVCDARKNYRNINVLLISDIDNQQLFEQGKILFKNFKKEFVYMGITTESPELGANFLETFSDNCDFFMIPYFWRNTQFKDFMKELKKKEKIVFVMKPFDDGRVLKTETIKEALEYILKQKNIDTIFCGTSDEKHLEEIIEVYKNYAN